MEQKQKEINEKLKDILQALNTENAQKVLKELEKENPKVKKNLLHELITDISNFTDFSLLSQKISDLNHVISLQQNFILDQKKYTIRLENKIREFSSKSLNSINELKDKIFVEQNAELNHIFSLLEELEVQQANLVQNNLPQENQMEILANSNQDNQESEKIISIIENVITKSEKILRASKEFQDTNGYRQSKIEVKENIQKLINIIEINLKTLKELKKFMTSRICQFENHAQLKLEIDKKNEEIKKNNEKNRVQKEIFKEELNKIKLNLEKQADEKIKKVIQNQQLFEVIVKKFEELKNGLKQQLYIFNQAIIKGIIEQQTYFFTSDPQKIKQSIQLGDLQKIQKLNVPQNIRELQQHLDQMRELCILEPAKEQLKSFGDFAKNLEDQINKFLI